MTADTIGGVSSYALELAAAVAPHGVEVALATLGGPLPASMRKALRALGNVSLHESRYRLEWMPDPWSDVARAGEWLLELEDRVEPDVIHLNHLAHGDLPFHRPVLVVGHSCVLSWWEAVQGTAIPPSWSRYRERVRQSLRGARAVAAPSHAMLHALRRHYGPLRREFVVPNGRDPSAYRSGLKEPLILSAGRLWDEAKNVAALAAAAPEVLWPIVVAGATIPPGGGAQPPLDVERMRALQWIGALSSSGLADWYARAAVYALPARYEPFGLTALEAALSGCALVLGDIASLEEVWGDAAWYVDPEDHTALRDALNELAGDPARRAALAERAHERARAYAPQRMAAGYLAVYHDLLADRRALGARQAAGAARAASCVPREHPA